MLKLSGNSVSCRSNMLVYAKFIQISIFLIFVENIILLLQTHNFLGFTLE